MIRYLPLIRNIMKFLKGLFLWVIAWQVVSLLTKDKQLREKLAWEGSIWDKAKLLGDWLIDLNKSIINDVSSINWSEQVSRVEEQLKTLVDNIWDTITSEQKEAIKKTIDQASILVAKIKNFTELKIGEINNNLQLSEKLEKIKSHIEWLKTKLEKSSEQVDQTNSQAEVETEKL